MIIMCSDKPTIIKLKAMGLKSINENEEISKFFVDKNSIEKLNFDNEISSKIIFSNKLTF